MLKKRIISIFLSMFVGVSCLIGCGGNTTSSSSKKPGTSNGGTTTYTVSYYVDGTQYGDTLNVEEGAKLEKPVDPVKDADEDYTYNFAGWYLNGAENPWNFEVDVVNSNIELYADFDKTAIEYDLSVWVYGGTATTEENTYITEEEFTRVKETAGADFASKKVLFKYYSGMNNDAFNAKVLSTSRLPDVVISGSKMDKGDNASLVLHETYPKTKVGTGWFSSTTRHVGVLETCTKLEDAATFYNTMVDLGPDYFAFEAESITLRVGQPYTLTPTLLENETRTVTYTSLDEEIATVDTTGAVTALKEGKVVINATLGLVTIKLDLTVVSANYDLVVFVYGRNSSDDVYITEDESNYIKEELLKTTEFTDKEVYWEYVGGIKNDAFNTVVLDNISQGFIIDVVISGNNLNSAKTDVPVPLDATYGKVNVGAGWFENTSRKTAITDACDANMELAIAAYNFFTSTSPKYEGVVIEEETATVTVEETVELHATAYGTITWTSSDENIAIVENGVVTGVAAGEATITATSQDGATDTCVVTVKAKEVVKKTYKLVVYVYGGTHTTAKNTYITAEESEDLRQAYLTASGLTEEEVLWEFVTGVGNEDFNITVNSAITDGTIVDVVVSGNKMDDAEQAGIALDATNGKAQVGDGWFANTSRKVAITDACDANMANAVVLYNLLVAAKA